MTAFITFASLALVPAARLPLELAQVFIKPVKLFPGGRLWMFLPLALCVAIVYRATRSRTPAELPRSTAFTFINIVVGMALVAVGLYVVHEVVLRLS